jgi:hypothetical protein
LFGRMPDRSPTMLSCQRPLYRLLEPLLEDPRGCSTAKNTYTLALVLSCLKLCGLCGFGNDLRWHVMKYCEFLPRSDECWVGLEIRQGQNAIASGEVCRFEMKMIVFFLAKAELSFIAAACFGGALRWTELFADQEKKLKPSMATIVTSTPMRHMRTKCRWLTGWKVIAIRDD